jgi:hypothetical protein
LSISENGTFARILMLSRYYGEPLFRNG